MKKYKTINYLILLIICAFTLLGCNSKNISNVSASTNLKSNIEAQSENGNSLYTNNTFDSSNSVNVASATSLSIENIPKFTDKPYVTINNNEPFFEESDYTSTSFEKYSDLDNLGRCGLAFANIGQDLMPTEERGAIGMIKPSGWQTVKYDNVSGKYLYNRCHLIGYQLTAENANEKNLITGTRYLNIEGMLPFENMLADYIKETGNHVLYRVTPIYEGNNLLANGVLMEGKSVEDNGSGICFNIFAYNNQPGISINYANGDSFLLKSSESKIDESATNTAIDTNSKSEKKSTEESTNQSTVNTSDADSSTYILNTNSHKFHLPTCSSVKRMSDSNKEEVTATRDELIKEGYEPCKICNP